MIAHLNHRAICFAAQIAAIVLLMAVPYATGQTVTPDNATHSSDSIRYPELIVNDSTAYSSAFLAGLRESRIGASRQYASIYRLEDSLLIIDTDTLTFPVDLPTNTTAVFIGTTQQESMTLSLTRINYTTMHYSLIRSRRRKPLPRLSGSADLLPTFWLGSETDEDRVTGEGYLSTEYRNEGENIAIRIGVNSEGNLRVFFNRWSDDPKEVIESPMLRQQ